MYTIAKAKEAVKCGIKGYLLKDQNGCYVMKEVNRLPFYLEGSPGIGKTEIVRQIADELNIGYVSFSLVHHTRNSLLGLPVITELESGDKYTRYTMSEIIAKVLEQVEKGKQEGILLLDEFPCMSETILPAMLAFLQTKNIGTHHLPEGWVVVLCGNPPAYNKTARTFDSAIMDRIRKLEITFEPEVFLEYGKKIGLHKAIIDYLEVNKDKTYRYVQQAGQMELVTCRGWENVSHMLKTYEVLGQEVEQEDIRQYLKSEEISLEFYRFLQQYHVGLSAECAKDILDGIHLTFYEQRFREMDYGAQWNLLEYFIGYAETVCQGAKEMREPLNEAAAMVKELKKCRKKEFDLLPEPLDRTYRMSLSTFLDFIEYALEDDESEIRQESLKNLKEWMKEVASEEELDIRTDNFYVKAYDFVKRWQDSQQESYEQLMRLFSDKLENLFTFVKSVDTGGALADMMYNRVNNSELLLTILSKFPGEEYLKNCAKRYDMYDVCGL